MLVKLKRGANVKKLKSYTVSKTKRYANVSKT